MREWEAYPSTGDIFLPPIAGAQASGVLACVKGARERIAKGHTETSYISSSWPDEETYVCAMGGIFAEDGLTSKDIPSFEGRELLLYLETRLSEDAKEAIRLLDEAALEVVPESAQWEKTRWAGPLEWVNQDWYSYEYDKHGRPLVGTKEKILEIYDLVIERQSQVGV